MSETIQFGNLSVHIQNNGDTATYTFTGEVDESFKQKDLPRVKAKIIHLVLENITHFNSCGIREWVYLVRELSQASKLIFKRCSVAMVDQINMVPDSVTGGEVESFFAPYACEDHGEISKLIDLRVSKNQLLMRDPPDMTCDTCGKHLEFDALPGSYFLFVGPELSKAS